MAATWACGPTYTSVGRPEPDRTRLHKTGPPVSVYPGLGRVRSRSFQDLKSALTRQNQSRPVLNRTRGPSLMRGSQGGLGRTGSAYGSQEAQGHPIDPTIIRFGGELTLEQAQTCFFGKKDPEPARDRSRIRFYRVPVLNRSGLLSGPDKTAPDRSKPGLCGPAVDEDPGWGLMVAVEIHPVDVGWGREYLKVAQSDCVGFGYGLKRELSKSALRMSPQKLEIQGEEVKRLRDNDQKAKKAEEKRLTNAIKKVAAIEDQLRLEDIARDETANHPPSLDSDNGDQFEMDILEELAKGNPDIIPYRHAGSESEDNGGAPSDEKDAPEGPGPEIEDDHTDNFKDIEGTGPEIEDDHTDNSDEDFNEYKTVDDGQRESTSESDDGEAEQAPTKRKKAATKRPRGRAMIIDARVTTTASGTPTRLLGPSESNSTKCKGVGNVGPHSKKPKPSIPTRLSATWVKKNSQCSQMPAPTNGNPPVAGPPDDKMSRYGGIVDNDEYDDIEHAPDDLQPGRQRLSSKYQSLIQIIPRHQSRPPTQKQARAGAKKWTLAHLPENTSDLFADQLTPLAREMAGRLEPWAALSVANVQSLVDCVFGGGEYTVTKGNAWCGLVTYRLGNWRNGFASAACDAVQALINDNDNTLSTPDDIAYYINWSLKVEGQTAPFHWRNWGEGKVKKGLFQTPLIIRTFADAHVSGLEDPSMAATASEKPIGALLLSVQAVEHALGFWTSGAFVADTSPSQHFSADNWGDTVKQRKASTSSDKTGTYKVRHATKYLASVKNFKPDQWKYIFDEAEEYIVERRRKKKRNPPTKAGPDSAIIIDEDDDIVLVSDSGEESE
ncbi:hypothetical protein BD779DRAFT_1475902 [Infundibulicybe gibba]|nr:hypothetical protein BD779DRAFT_1475902 [Infundibulicybe gibba]